MISQFVLSAVVSVLAVQPGLSQDIRQCPVDRLVFFDLRGGTEFTVAQSFDDWTYLCLSSGGLVESDVPGADCRRVGSTHLAGMMHGADVVASYTIIWGSPCCSWSMQAAPDFWASSGFAGLVAHRPGSAPTLSDSGIYGLIERNEYRSETDITLLNPLSPIACQP